MKKPLIQTFFLTFFFLLSFGLWQSRTYSEDEQPYAAQCGENGCCAAYHGGMDALKSDWDDNLNLLLDQEKAASEMTEDAFENLRTYNCWLRYLCESVAYSSVADGASVQGTGITKKHIGVIPGCQAPENLSYEKGWNTFIETLKPGNAGIDQLILPNKLNFIPACASDGGSNTSIGLSSLYQGQSNYQACLQAIGKRTGECQEGQEGCEKSAINFVHLESQLKQAHADQKSRTLEKKLHDIVSNLSATVEVAETAKEGLNALDRRYACSPNKCD